MSPNVYHLVGPHGVKLATQRVREVLQEKKPQFFLRGDIKSYYRSIPHYKLMKDIKEIYSDPKVQAMLTRIITNEVETP
jgi:RNA-directed DNA polymerase